MKGYLVSTTSKQNMNKIIDRIRFMGKEYYLFRKCYPIYLVTIDNEQKIVFEADQELSELMYLLGFSFEGLITDDEKINEIEEYGKYRCYVEKLEEIPQNIIIDEMIIE